MRGFEVCPNTATSNFSTPCESITYISNLWAVEINTNFGVLLTMHTWSMTVGLWGSRFFSDLDVGACIF